MRGSGSQIKRERVRSQISVAKEGSDAGRF